MLEKQISSKIFECFVEKLAYNFDTYNEKIPIEDYEKSIDKIISEINKNSKNEDYKNKTLFNYVARIINENNIFDYPITSICALKVKSKTLNLISLFFVPLTSIITGITLLFLVDIKILISAVSALRLTKIRPVVSFSVESRP